MKLNQANKNVDQVLPDNRQNLIKNNSCVVGPDEQILRMSALLNNTPSSVLTGHLPPHGEAAHFNAPSTWRERVECVSTGVRGIFKEEALNKNDFRAPLRSGFTLIELLVVVLIIGILAAIALPQYQLAVLKARGAEALVGLDAVAKMQQTYYLTHGNYAEDVSLLDFQWGKEMLCSGREGFVICYVAIDSDDRRLEYNIYPNKNVKRKCLVRMTDSIGKKWCQLYGTWYQDEGGYSYYQL